MKAAQEAEAEVLREFKAMVVYVESLCQPGIYTVIMSPKKGGEENHIKLKERKTLKWKTWPD